MNKYPWIIHIIANGIPCSDCGNVHNDFPDYICNVHTHGMVQYGHPEFQMVLHISLPMIGYILNELGCRVRDGQHFSAGERVSGIIRDYDLRLDEFEENGRKVLRVILPDAAAHFPEDPGCEYPYSMQIIPTDQLENSGTMPLN